MKRYILAINTYTLALTVDVAAADSYEACALAAREYGGLVEEWQVEGVTDL